MLDIIYTIFTYSYGFYRLKGFFGWIIGTTILGMLFNIYGLTNKQFPRFFLAFASISFILLIVILIVNIILMSTTGWGKNPESRDKTHKRIKKIFCYICIFGSAAGNLICFILFICQIACKFKKSPADIFLFFLWDCWVAILCFYMIITKLISFEMQSMKEISKELERRAKRTVNSESKKLKDKKEDNVLKINQKTNSDVQVFNKNSNNNEDNGNIYPSLDN